MLCLNINEVAELFCMFFRFHSSHITSVPIKKNKIEEENTLVSKLGKGLVVTAKPVNWLQSPLS